MGSELAAVEELLERIRDSRLPPISERRTIREGAGVSIREAAAALAVAPMTYLRWERGDAEPRRQHAIEYRRFLDRLRSPSA